MFILKRKDVEISSIQHPKRDQQVPILSYQGQTFRLLSVFAANQAEEARNFWRDLTDHQGKACVLLEETERYTVWGKVRLEQLNVEETSTPCPEPSNSSITQACILLLQTVYLDVEDLLGTRQAKSFQKDISEVFQQWHFPQADSPQAVESLLTVNPLSRSQTISWEEHHLITLLQELYRIGKEYFGNDSFTEGILEILQDLPENDKKEFMNWLNKTPLGKLWR